MHDHFSVWLGGAISGGLAFIGIHNPALFVLGMVGGWWALTYRDPLILHKRISAVFISGIVGAISSPLCADVIISNNWLAAQHNTLTPFLAVAFGFFTFIVTAPIVVATVPAIIGYFKARLPKEWDQ
jgi:nucleoside phosphorylase